MPIIRKVFGDNGGATAIEYGLIAALVAIAAVVAMRNMADSIENTFATAGRQLDTENTRTLSGGTGGTAR